MARNGNTPVQLWPYDQTTNQGGEYKAWLIEKAILTVTATMWQATRPLKKMAFISTTG